MTFFNVFRIYQNSQSFIHDNLRNVSKVQQSLQTNCDFATSFIRFASNIFVSKISLQFIFFNKRAIIDFVSFSLFFNKRFRLTSFVQNIRDRKSSTSCVSASSSVDIRVIQTVTIKCESLKKRRDRFSKIKADVSQHKFNVAKKKRRDKSIKSNVASLNKEESNSSIKRKTINEIKNVKSIRFETMKKKKTRKKKW